MLLRTEIDFVDFPRLYIFRVKTLKNEFVLPGIIRGNKYFILKKIDTNVPYIDTIEYHPNKIYEEWMLKNSSLNISDYHDNYYFIDPDKDFNDIFRIFRYKGKFSDKVYGFNEGRPITSLRIDYLISQEGLFHPVPYILIPRIDDFRTTKPVCI